MHNEPAVVNEETADYTSGKRFKAITSDMVPYLGRAFNYGYGNTVAHFPGRLDADRLHRATQLSVNAEPILGCRFVEGWYRPHWQRRHDLEQIDLFTLVDTADPDMELERCLTKYLDPRYDPQVQVFLIRSDSDILCIKLNHMVGDASANYEYLCLLTVIYNRLAENPNYLPPINYSGRAVIQQISRQFDFPQKLRILRHVISTMLIDRRNSGSWNLPIPKVKHPRLTYVARKYPDRLKAISVYCAENRVTTFNVLLAAYYLALRTTVPQSTYRPLPLLIPISLRRYLPADHPMKILSALGGTMINLDAPADSPLDDVVVQVQDQMKGQKYLGLQSITLISTFPGINLALKAVPFRLAAKLFRHRAARLVREGKIRACVFTAAGHYDFEQLRFGNQDPEHVYVTASTIFAVLFPVIVSMFRQTLTLSVNFSERLVERRTVEAIFDKMDQLLPR